MWLIWPGVLVAGGTNGVTTEAPNAQDATKDREALIQVLGSRNWKDEKARYAVLRALAELDDKKSIPLLLALLPNASRGQTNQIVDMLGKYADPETIAPLAELLKSKEGPVRENAARALARFNNPAVKDHLEPFLQDEDATLRHLALATYHNLKLTPTAEQRIKLSEDTVEGIRWSNLDFVQGEKDDPAHERVLLNGLKDKSVMVKVTAIRICRMYYAKTSVALMRPLLSDPSVMIRGEACQTLVASQDPAALEAARSLITDKDPQVRAALALACRYTATKQADEILETLYRDPSPEVRLQVIRSIMGKKRVPHLMTQALKDENSTIAVLALSNFLQQKGSNASESFFEILKRADNEAKHSLCGMVNYLDEPAQSQAIELLYNDKAERVRQVLVGMAGGFSEENFWKLTALAIVDKAPSVREALCGALTTKGPSPRKQALLERLLNDSDERVSARARFAMRG